jgi:hypothetical protein
MIIPELTEADHGHRAEKSQVTYVALHTKLRYFTDIITLKLCAYSVRTELFSSDNMES